jgi:adenylate kinase family enzyme
MNVYREETEPLVVYYQGKGVYARADGMAAIETVTRSLVSIISGSAAEGGRGE